MPTTHEEVLFLKHLNSMQCCAALNAPAALQVQEVQSRRLQDSQAVRAASLLPVDWASVVGSIEEGRLNDVDAITDEILAVSRAAADHLAEAQGTGEGQISSSDSNL